jgi:hypothetical protein
MQIAQHAGVGDQVVGSSIKASRRGSPRMLGKNDADRTRGSQGH